MVRHDTLEFWSDKSGNQEALNDCLEFLTRQREPAPLGRPEVMMVLAEPGCGATAFARQLNFRLRERGQRVLLMDKVSVRDPGRFKSNLDVSLQIHEISKRAGSTSATLHRLQRAVLEARHYDAFIVHDLENYGSDEVDESTNAAAIVELIRGNPEAGFVLLGVPYTAKWMKVALRDANIESRTLQLLPMPADERFVHFITSLALRVQPPCPLERIDEIDVAAVHAMSKGKVGQAVTTLMQQIADLSTETSTKHQEHQEHHEAYLHHYVAEVASEISTMWVEAYEEEESVSRDRGQAVGHTGSGKQTPVIASEPFSTDLRHSFPAMDNESFSSWVARLSMVVTHSSECMLVEELIQFCSKGGTDPDMQFGNLELLRSLSVADRLYISEQFRTAVADMIPYQQALNYCPGCFTSDLAAGVSPAWRLEWRQARRCVCLRHDTPVMLERVGTSGFTLLDKAWRAYAEYIDSPASRLTTKFPLQHSSSNQAEKDSDRLVALTAKVQSWFEGLSATTSPSADAAEFLLACWLQDSSETGAQGFARSYFFFRTSKPISATKRQQGKLSAQLMPDSSRPRDVAVAYWMLGIAFNVIDSADAQFIRDTTRPYSIPFPVSLDEVGLLGLLALNKRQKKCYLALARTRFSERDFESIAWAL
ncbi:TniQ family protein [Pseudomonas mandelii]|uniref:TniQ domain-containing protein n=1 Tax=Pseudomonas mandelii TaxID=75612 RepID=A0A502HQX7_9PSED|nr:TniQ family protein [Pseudomonas mandelii]TPG77209.1 hypothetical protein EAH74_28245 [Pseudomonas mandelii]